MGDFCISLGSFSDLKWSFLLEKSFLPTHSEQQMLTNVGISTLHGFAAFSHT